MISAERTRSTSTFQPKIYVRSLKVQLADLVEIHLGVEVDPVDGKPSRICARCLLKVCITSTLFEFIRTALNCENTYEGRPGEKQFKRVNVVSQRKAVTVYFFGRLAPMPLTALPLPTGMLCSPQFPSYQETNF